MKQKLKALASLCLALALTLCLTLPAWAAGGGLNAGSKSTVTITGLPETSTENLKVTAYKIIEVNYYSVEDDEATTDVDESYDAPYDPAFDWVSQNDTTHTGSKSVAEWVRDNHSTYIGRAEPGKEPDNSVQAAFKKDAPGVNFAAFYDDLANAIRNNDVTFGSGYTVENGNNDTTGTDSTSSSITLEQEGEGDSATVTCKLNNFEMGSYLVLIEGGMKIYKPVVVNLTPKWENGAWTLSQDVPALTAKYSEPSITKTVRDTADGATEERKYAQVDIGDTVTYTLVADVPQFPADAINKGYVISDDLPDGMTLGDVTVYGVKPGSGGTTEAEVELHPKQDGTNTDPDLTYTLTTPTAGGTVSRPEGVDGPQAVNFKVEFSDIVAIYEEGYTKVKVTYTATANEKILVVSNNGNTHVNQNTAYLDYNNNPYEKKADGSRTWKTASDTADVYTYGIKVTKTDDNEEDPTPLAGAEFQVYKDEDKDGEIDDGERMLNFVADANIDGVYRVAANNEANSLDKVTTIGGTSTTDPNLTLSGLDVGTYILKETKAPAGYNLPSHTFSVTITDDQTISVENGGTTTTDTPNGKPEYTPNGAPETDRADGYERTTITNTKGFTLPTTGGMGTVLFTAGGVVLMGAGLVLLVVFLRRRRAK